MNFDKPAKQDGAADFTYKPDWSLNGHHPVWPDLMPSKDCSPSGVCPAAKPDLDSVKTLEDRGWLHRFTLSGGEQSKSEDLYRFGGAERATKKADHAITLEEYEVRIKELEARLATQTEKLERLIALQVAQSDRGDIFNGDRPIAASQSAGGAHFVYDKNGNGQLIGPHGERQYNMIDGEKFWIDNASSSSRDWRSSSLEERSSTIDDKRPSTIDSPAQIRIGCSNGSCGSCSSCRPRPRFLR